jgi:hypothetical protein
VMPPTNSPNLEYQIYLFHPGKVEVEAILAPTLNSVPDRGLRYTISFDDQPPQIIDSLAQDSVHEWEQSVKDSVRKVGRHISLRPWATTHLNFGWSIRASFYKSSWSPESYHNLTTASPPGP